MKAVEKTFPAILESHARDSPNNAAILSLDRKPLTYDALNRHCINVSSILFSLGISRSDRVAIVLPNGPEMATSFLAVLTAASAAPLNPDYREQEFEFFLEDLKAAAVIVQSRIESPARTVAKKLEIPLIELIPDSEVSGLFELEVNGNVCQPEGNVVFPASEDEALVLHTSGTTSRPKMVPLSQSNLAVSAGNIGSTLEVDTSDTCLNVMPLFHIHGLMACLLASLKAGASVVCTKGFSAPTFFDDLSSSRATWYSAVPTMHQGILARMSRGDQQKTLPKLRFIRSSSASLAPSVMESLESAFQAPVVEAYGMTEATHQMASNPLPPEIRKPGSVGRAAGPDVGIMGEDSTLLRAGETGEIVIRGASVTAGYAENPEANESAFDNGWFRTGDEGYLDDEGYLYITGRLKEIINRGGEKISPREVDEILLSHPSVRQVVVFAMPDDTLGEEVAAAVVLEDGSDTAERELQEYAAGRLADFKVPRRIVYLDTIPKGPTGKLRRIGLAEQLGLTKTSRSPASDAREISAPTDDRAPTELEMELSAIWTEVLKIDEIGLDEDFFSLGGDSILVTGILGRIHSMYPAVLSFLDFFTSPTIRGLAQRLEEEMSSEPEGGSQLSIPVGREVTSVPATPSQKGMVFLEMFDPANRFHNRPLVLRLSGSVDGDLVESAVHEIIQRHDALRSRIVASGDDFEIQTSDVVSIALLAKELDTTSGREEGEQIQQVVSELLKQPIRLDEGPLVFGTLLRRSQNEHLLIIVTHHAVFDGWSEQIFIDDFVRFYGAESGTTSISVPELTVSYADYALWLSTKMDSREWKKARSFWMDALKGVEPISLPTDFPRPEKMSSSGASFTSNLSTDLYDAVRSFAQQCKTTPFIVFLSVYLILLRELSGQVDLAVGVPVSGRSRPEFEGMIGLFINMIVIRSDFSDCKSFRDVVETVGSSAKKAYTHQEFPFELVVEAVNPPRFSNRTPLYQTVFIMERPQRDSWSTDSLHVERYDVVDTSTLTDMSWELIERDGSCSLSIRYNTDLYKKETIEGYSRQYRMILATAIERPGSLLDS